MRGKVLWGIAGLLFLAGTAMAKPGDTKWTYSASGGPTFVSIDSKGNRVFATSKASTLSESWLVVSLNSNGKLNWQSPLNNGSPNGVLCMVVDSKNNIIVGGTEATASGWGWKIVSYSSSGNVNWEKFYPGVMDYPKAMAVDSNDNIIVAGIKSNGAHDDWRILSLSPSGIQNWERTFDGGDEDFTSDVVVDSNDNAIVAGYTTRGGKEYWKIVSYSPSGGINWDKTLGNNYNCYVYSLAVTHKDSIIAVGSFETSTGKEEWKVMALSLSSGAQIWENSLSGTGDGYALSVVVDAEDNIIVAGNIENQSIDCNIVSYSPSGGITWRKTHTVGTSSASCKLAIDSNNNIIVAGFQKRTTLDWLVLCYSCNGTLLWEDSLDSGQDDVVFSVATDKSSGDVVVAGYTMSETNAFIINYEGYPPLSPLGHTLVPQEVRTVKPAAKNPDPNNGRYLGFGSVVANGTTFKVEAAFPQYLQQSDNSTLTVKIFIAAQMPDDYSRLAFFDNSNNLLYQPPNKLSSWKTNVNGAISKTVLIPSTDISAPLTGIPSGTHYWYTLVVPNTVPDDFAGVDWNTTPWEITVSIVEVQK